MSTHIKGFKPPNQKWRDMKAVWDTCEEADVEPPKEVYDFFEGEAPDEAGVEVDLEKLPCVKTHNADMQEGFEVYVNNLPEDITVIRFYNSY
jgi:hypothetical protein